jgi:hypothetical protein
MEENDGKAKRTRRLRDLPDDFAERVRCITQFVLPERIELESGNAIDVRMLGRWINGIGPGTRNLVDVFCRVLKMTYRDFHLSKDKFATKFAKVSKNNENDIRVCLGLEELGQREELELLAVTRSSGYQSEKVKDWFEKVFKGYWYVWNNWLDIYEGKKTPVSVKSLLWAHEYDRGSNTIRVQLTTRLWYTEGPSMRWTYAGWAILTDRKCYLILEDVQGSENEIMTIITNRPDYPVDTNTLYGLVLTTADDRKTKEAIPTATRVVLTKINTPYDEVKEEELREHLKEVDTYSREAFAGASIGESSMEDLVTCELDQTNVLTYKMPEEALSRKR